MTMRLLSTSRSLISILITRSRRTSVCAWSRFTVEAGFAQLVVEAKKDFATSYALDADYWDRVNIDESPEVVGFLKTNLTDLAGHYHALYQEDVFVDEQPANFVEANRWYRQLLGSFPDDAETPGINYQLADLLLENEDFIEAAHEYERTAYSTTRTTSRLRRDTRPYTRIGRNSMSRRARASARSRKRRSTAP